MIQKDMKEVDRILIELVDKNKTPSVQYLIFTKDSVIHRFQKGFADINNKKDINQNTTYNAFSVTKTFTALAILQLAEKESLNIDKPVNEYLSDFTYSSNITIRQLLTHSAGIPNPIPLSWIHLTNEHQDFNIDEFFKQIFQENSKTKSEPNEKYSYSNLGYVILGQIIEKVSGLTYENYIEKNIIKKIGATPNELSFTINPKNHAKGYHKKWSFSNLILGFFIDKSKYMSDTEGKWKSFKNIYVNGAPYGGLIGTAEGFMKYLQELMKLNNKLLSDKFMEQLFTENITTEKEPTGMCLSWFKGAVNGNEYYAHAGGGGGYYCEIRIYPEIEIGSVIMFNRTGMKDERFLDNIDKYYIGNK